MADKQKLQPPHDPRRAADLASPNGGDALLEPTKLVSSELGPETRLDTSAPLSPAVAAELTGGVDLSRLEAAAAERPRFRRPIEPIAQPNYDAQRQLETIMREQELERQKARQSDEKEYQHFIKCRRGHLGVYLLTNPHNRQIGLDAWYATYRDATERWPEEVYCQVCYDVDPETGDPRGSRQPLAVTYVATGRRMAFIVPPKIAWRYPRDPARRAVEGITRSAPVDYASGNLDWHPSQDQMSKEAIARAAALRLVGGAT